MPKTLNEQLPIEPTPEAWPGAFGLYKYSRAAMMVNVGAYLGILALTFAVNIASGFVDPQSSMYVIINTIASLVSVWFQAALIIIVLHGVKRYEISFDESLRLGGAKFGALFLQSLVMGLIAIVSLLLLVVPAFIILPRLALAEYFLIDKNMGIIESIKASWEATRGHIDKVWGIFGANVVMTLLALTIVGIPFSIYFLFMYTAANAILYFWLVKHGANQDSGKAAVGGPVAPMKG